MISVDVGPCACGAGTIETTVELDDWNRIRRSTAFLCPKCKTEYEKLLREREVISRERARLLDLAQSLAIERYFTKWRDTVDGRSKKDVWKRCTGGNGYPSLGTFYKHVEDEGLENWLQRWFKNNLATALEQIGVYDEEVLDLLIRRERIPEYREPHPWQ